MQVVQPKEHPAQHDEHEYARPTDRDRETVPIAPKPVIHTQGNAVYTPPEHEVPARPVPEAARKEEQTVLHPPLMTGLKSVELGQQIAGLDDRPRNEMRKQLHETGKVPEVGFGGDLAAVHIDGVANRLKGGEGDPGRQHDGERRGEGHGGEADEVVQRACHLVDRIEEEVTVLEEPEQTEPEAERRDHVGAACSR